MQGSRVSAGLGPVQQVSSLKFVLRSVVLQQAPPAFDDAIAAIDAAGVIPDIRDWGEMITENAQDAKEYGKLKGDPLSADGIAYVMGYSDEATTPPLYADMNNKSYDKDRSLFTPYSQYMVGLVKHMKGIEVYPNHQVFRGVKVDLRDQYPQGRKVTWHGFCSTTKSAKVLENPLFCGEVGKRTIFAIQLTQGQAREISRYSLVESEDEILLPPGCKFEVQSVLPQGDLTIIQLLEVASKDWVFDLSPPAAAAPGMFQFGDLLKELGMLEADAPDVQPALDEHGLLSAGQIASFLTAECGGVTADGLKQMGIKKFGTRDRMLKGLLKKAPAPAPGECGCRTACSCAVFFCFSLGVR
jgi:hypothetical protein